jgi:hypothetical protein
MGKHVAKPSFPGDLVCPQSHETQLHHLKTDSEQRRGCSRLKHDRSCILCCQHWRVRGPQENQLHKGE